MLRSVFDAMETGLLAEISLLAFVIGFVVIQIRVFTLPKKDRIDAKNMPINDPEETY